MATGILPDPLSLGPEALHLVDFSNSGCGLLAIVVVVVSACGRWLVAIAIEVNKSLDGKQIK